MSVRCPSGPAYPSSRLIATNDQLCEPHAQNYTPSTMSEIWPPRAIVSRQVHEQGRQGTHVGDPIVLSDPDVDTLTYSLARRGSEEFHVDSDGQIAVSELGELDYETRWSCVLSLDVSDGMGMTSDGTATTSDEVDQSIEVRIALEDVEHDVASLLLEVSDEEPALNEAVTFTTMVSGLPDGHSGDIYYWWIKEPHNGGWCSETAPFSRTISRGGGEHRFFVQLQYRHNDRWYVVTSNEVVVTWGGT